MAGNNVTAAQWNHMGKVCHTFTPAAQKECHDLREKYAQTVPASTDDRVAATTVSPATLNADTLQRIHLACQSFPTDMMRRDCESNYINNPSLADHLPPVDMYNGHLKRPPGYSKGRNPLQ